MKPPVRQTNECRVWITALRQRRPAHACGLPTRAVALLPVPLGSPSPDAAREFVRTFNTKMAETDSVLWAILVPVTGTLEGGLQPGQPCRRMGRAFRPSVRRQATC
jgi:hypothetical protein